jgi:hypothetical protein
MIGRMIDDRGPRWPDGEPIRYSDRLRDPDGTRHGLASMPGHDDQLEARPSPGKSSKASGE